MKAEWWELLLKGLLVQMLILEHLKSNNMVSLTIDRWTDSASCCPAGGLQLREGHCVCRSSSLGYRTKRFRHHPPPVKLLHCGLNLSSVGLQLAEEGDSLQLKEWQIEEFVKQFQAITISH
ncbi:hypothetical protein E2C01_019925 [Portunus trituberculatus]|uniref:Uncharacterized protein n=1 Tax=Portunus trituberculatus TaxID=210409 RepID=A0A5B7E0C0_PORTR|nr:hypothetical protein [Portunus trituberculatus]